MIRGIPSNRCPADAFIKYFRECLEKQEEFKKQGQEIPEEYKIPDKVYLTKNCIRFFNEYSGADFLGAPKKENYDVNDDTIFSWDIDIDSKKDDIIFYWKEINNIPALELIMTIDENDKWIIKHIKEDAIGEQPAIEWEYDSKKVVKSTRIVYMNTNEINKSKEIEDPLETVFCQEDFER